MMEDIHDRSQIAPSLLSDLGDEEYCYLTTTGRVSGRPHEIEIWFGVRGGTLYFLSGGGESSDWVKNLRASPSAAVRIGKRTFHGMARAVNDGQEEALIRRLLAAKYQGWSEGDHLSEWARTALPVAIDMSVE
jgi:deazaflavin-dependent oxidoreductase (nitroreductase family)